MHLVSQSEQHGGYWLITMQLDSDSPLPVGYQLLLPNKPPLALFRQQQSQAEFLSISSLEEQDVSTLTDNRHTPAWQILSQQISSASEASAPSLLLAKDTNIANLFHFVQSLEQRACIAILEATDAFPFVVKPAQFLFEDFPAEAIGACPLLEDWKLPNRLCSSKGLMGCYDGSISELLEEWQPQTNNGNAGIIDFRTLNETLTNP